MRRKDLIVVTVVAVFALGAAARSPVLAQPKSKTSSATTPVGAFAKLSLGNQKVASALYQAQGPGASATSTNGTTPAARPLSLDEIAAKRRSGQEWGRIFREMKALGLVQEKSLGQVVSKYHQLSEPGSSVVASSNSSGKTSALEVGSNGSAGGAAHGIGKGGK